MKEQEKQIEEMAIKLKKMIKEVIHDIEDYSWKDIAQELYKMLLPKDSVVLSREELERLSSSHDIIFCDNNDCSNNILCRCAEISECPKNIPKYNEKLSVNKYKLDLFQKLCKERERADSWEDRYKLLEEELKQERKETAEKFIKECKKYKVKKFSSIGIDQQETGVSWIEMPEWKFDEFAKQFGVEIKEN